MGSASLWRRREMAGLTAMTGKQRKSINSNLVNLRAYVNEMQMTY